MIAIFKKNKHTFYILRDSPSYHSPEIIEKAGWDGLAIFWTTKEPHSQKVRE